MSLTIHTKQPRALVRALLKAIDDGDIDTWETSDRMHITHSPAQWRCKAWMKLPKVIGEDTVRFTIIRPKGKNVSKSVYAVYHGRFAEMLLSHFDSKIDRIEISSLASQGDMV